MKSANIETYTKSVDEHSVLSVCIGDTDWIANALRGFLQQPSQNFGRLKKIAI